MGKVKMPLGKMDSTIRDVKANGRVITINADVGTAPPYVGKVSIELTPEDIGINMLGAVVWGIKAVFYLALDGFLGFFSRSQKV